MPAKATRAANSTAQPAAGEEPAEPAVKRAAKKAARAAASPPAPAAPPTDDSGDSAAEADEFVPTNRAERRAKGRGKATAQASGGRGKVSGGLGPTHTQRNWANRRTG